MTGLRIARGFALPVDVAGEAIAILAKRGAAVRGMGQSSIRACRRPSDRAHLRAVRLGVFKDGVRAPSQAKPVLLEELLLRCEANGRGDRLRQGARLVLELLYDAGPSGYTAQELAAAAGYEPGGSSYRAAIAALRNVDLVTPSGVDPIRASDELMETA